MYRSYNGLAYHIRKHMKGVEEVEEFQCPLCHQILKGKKRTARHILRKHPAHVDEIEVLVGWRGECVCGGGGLYEVGLSAIIL